jgi:hypothetical protein
MSQNFMVKDTLIAVALTLVFSIGTGVLFVRTIADMIEAYFNDPPGSRPPGTDPRRG